MKGCVFLTEPRVSISEIKGVWTGSHQKSIYDKKTINSANAENLNVEYLSNIQNSLLSHRIANSGGIMNMHFFWASFCCSAR
jgi:hypothetical protein